MEIKQAILEGAKILRENKIDNASNIARVLMSYMLNKPREYLVINDKEILNDAILNTYKYNISRIKNGYPLQYITNHQEFMGLDFYVNENVLIPQPDTEILVEEVLKICQQDKKIKILDLCTGSGAIAITLAKKLKDAEITGIDISEQALLVASKNAENNDVKVNFIKSDMFNNINDKFDIIVSNPPYIEKTILSTLPKDVQHEPMLALDGGEDGLDFYREISKEAYKYLNAEGYLALEIGYNQKDSVTQILQNENKYKEIISIKDFANNDRLIITQLM